MRDIRKIWSIRLAAGALLGAILTTLLAWLLLSFGVSNGQSIPVSPAAVQFYGSAALALVVQLLLGGLFGAVVSLATLPFANEGKKLVLLSLVHWGATVLCFSLLLTGCRWLDFGWDLLLWVALLTLLYFLIWLGRWIGWYMEVIQLRELLGLAAGPSPLKWRDLCGRCSRTVRSASALSNPAGSRLSIRPVPGKAAGSMPPISPGLFPVLSAHGISDI